MAIVAGVDFGTLSVRVSIVENERGLLGSAVAEYPLHRKREDPEYATQSHEDHMRALADRDSRSREGSRYFRPADRSHCPGYHGLLGGSGWKKPAAARRILFVVRSSSERGSG